VEWPIELKGSPFRGLAAFGVKHAPVFFGRSRDIARAVDAWKDAAARGSPFLLVVGASGAGKSSLARAGLVPRLTASGVVPTVDLWRVAVMHPSEAPEGPIMSLARRLFDDQQDLPEDERGRPPALPEIATGDYSTPAELAALFAEAGSAASAPVTRALERAAEAERVRQGSTRQFHAGLLILVDQLDELFAPDVVPEQRAAFVRLLAGLTGTGQVWLLTTLRADLYERFLEEKGLLELKASGASYDLPPPGPAELAEIVRHPAEAAGLEFETDAASGERLDERLLRETDRPGMLPLLQLALDRLFEARVTTAKSSMLTIGAYESLGGLAGVIHREAERALIGLDQAEIARLPRLLLQLAALGEFDGVEASGTPASLTIHTVPLADATPDAPSRRLVHALVEARILLTTGEGAVTGIRLAHQRVLADWARARELINANIRFLSIRKDVEAQRRLWDEAGRSRDLLIQRGRALIRAESIVKDFSQELSSATLEFIRASGRRARMRQRLTAAAAVIFAILAVVAGGAGLLAKSEAQRAEGSLDAAKNAVNVIVVDIAQGLRYVAGVPTAKIQTILERVQDTVESLTRFAPDNGALSRVYLESLLEIAITYQTAGDMQRAHNSAERALTDGRELADRYRNDRQWKHQVSVALNRLGSIDLSRGAQPEALKAYEEAASIMRPIVAQDPNNVTWQRELAISLDGIGDVKSKIGDPRNALAAYDDGLAIIQSLAKADPSNLELRRQISVRLNETGEMRLATGDTLAAEADYKEGLAIARALIQQNPENTQWQRDVFFSLTRIGDLKAQIGDPAAAIGPYEEGVAIVHRLAKLDHTNPLFQLDEAQGLCKLGDVKLEERSRDYEAGLATMRDLVQRFPDNSRWQRELSVSLNKVGDVRLEEDNRDGAIAAYTEALTIVGHLTERDPENLVWQRDVALSFSKVGDVRLRTGDAAGAVANYEQALAKLRPLSEHDPNNTVWLRDVTIHLNKVGDAKLQTGNVSAAATAFDESLVVARRLTERDPTNTLWQSDLWLAFNKVGDIKLSTSDVKGAIASYQQAAAIVRRLSEPDPSDTYWLRNKMVTLNELGDTEMRVGKADGAAANYDEALAAARRLAELDGGNTQRQSELWETLYKLGQAKLGTSNPDAARDLFAQALMIIRGLTAKDPSNVNWQTNLVVNLYRIASLQDGPARIQTLNEALQILQQLRDTGKLTPDKIGWPDAIAQMLAPKPSFLSDAAVKPSGDSH
jgi:tetratricopeptide (TPR) repeat protein